VTAHRNVHLALLSESKSVFSPMSDGNSVNAHIILVIESCLTSTNILIRFTLLGKRYSPKAMRSSRRKKSKNLTIDDIAALSGVSYQTVSRVLNGMRYVSPTTREKVQSVMHRFGFRPNIAARQLASQRSTTVGLVTFATSFYGPAQILANCEQASKEQGLSFMFSGIVDQSIPEIQRAVNELCAHQVCGILLYLPFRMNLRELQDVCRNVPIVAVDSRLGFKCPAIYIAQELGSRIATRHLIQLGHRKIAYLKGPAFWQAAELRFKGWLKELKAAGLNPGPVVAGDWTAESGFGSARKLVTQNWGQFSALVAANDQMALGAIRAFEEGGIRIPRVVSVVGFDDIPEAGFLRPPLSTIKQDFAALARWSVQCLTNQLNSTKEVRLRTIQPTFVERKSTAEPVSKGR
jgi:DNA-binding LacI/PurR family transcriptional regulator